MNNIVRISFFWKNTKFDQKTVSLLCVKTKSGAHKQLTFYFQMRKYFCRHLHSSLISMPNRHLVDKTDWLLTRECFGISVFVQNLLFSIQNFFMKWINFAKKINLFNYLNWTSILTQHFCITSNKIIEHLK
jgi:hypothetical protein